MTLICSAPGCPFSVEEEDQTHAERVALFHTSSGDEHFVECWDNGRLVFEVKRETTAAVTNP